MSPESDNEPPESVPGKSLSPETDNEPSNEPPESVLRKPLPEETGAALAEEAAPVPEPQAAPAAPANLPKGNLPKGVEITPDSATLRRRAQDERTGLEMLEQLEAQANGILALADATERGDGPQHYAVCRTFRQKLGEFETFCSVIETHLRKLAGDASAELDPLFHKNRVTILRPAVKALTVMYTRMARDGLPFGFLTVLDDELRAVDGMRDMIRESKDFVDDDRVLLEEIDKLETLMMSLRGTATEFAEL
jgi:hypothetical protein